MRDFYQTLVWKGNLRRLFAGAILVLLLAEWGSHAMIAPGPEPAEARSVSARDNHHGDPCDYLILCSDSGRRDQQSQGLGRDAVQHNGLLDLLSGLHPCFGIRDVSKIEFSSDDGLLRPGNPPFHPPELS